MHGLVLLNEKHHACVLQANTAYATLPHLGQFVLANLTGNNKSDKSQLALGVS